MTTTVSHVASIAEAVRTLSREHGLDQTLTRIAQVAGRSVPGFEHVGISIVTRSDEIETRAATDPLVEQFDDLQYELGEGPCLSAMREQPVVTVPFARHDQRWPAYMPRAVALGLRSQLAVRLFLDESGTLGALNFYSMSRDTLHVEAEPLADLFAAHAASALERTREVSELNAALESRKIIGQAIGIVMERYGLHEDRAFAFLVRASSHGNVKIRDLALRLVSEHNAR